MEQEKLKHCADAVGYKAEIVGQDIVVWHVNAGTWIKYDPEHNESQAMELLKYAMSHGWEFGMEQSVYIAFHYVNWNLDNCLDFRVTGKTLNECAINAVCEVKK